MNKAILIQARMSSCRFPNKMMAKIDGVPLIQFVYNNCTESSQAGIVAVVTSIESSDDVLSDYCKDNNIPVYRGSLNNVLERYINAAKHFNCSLVGRVCGDSPFVDIENLDNMFALAISSDLDYVRHEQSIAGLLSEIVSFSALEKVQKLTTKEEDLEHVTVYILNHENDFKVDIKRTKVKSNSTYTIDYRRDLDFCNNFLKENNKNSLINII
jgi:spore coat polysaccharide biosynthesis protein SpsF (cytidylyltransferase family)